MTPISSDPVDVTTLRDWLARPAPVRVLDVRSPAEFETAHIPGSLNVPLDVLAKNAEVLGDRLDGAVVLVCQSGMRAAHAQRCLAGVGVDSARALRGGIAAYLGAGGEVVQGRARWSLERQVRLVAGALVLAGLAVGLRVPTARLLAAGIGAGLTVSALTDTCTMGRILSALPYNRGRCELTPTQVLAQLSSPNRTDRAAAAPPR